MSYEIRSLFKVGGTFVPIDIVLESPEDPDYIEGAIIWRLGQKTILDERHWDLVDQLWAYIITGLGEFLKSGKYETHFPDQPLLLRFNRMSQSAAQVTVGRESMIVDYFTMLHSLVEGGTAFFTKLRELLPQHDITWNRYLLEIARIRRTMGEEGEGAPRSG